MEESLNEKQKARLFDTAEFMQVSIKKAFVNQIEQILKKHPEYGYKSVSDFLEDAVTSCLKEIRHIMYIYSIALVFLIFLLSYLIIFGS